MSERVSPQSMTQSAGLERVVHQVLEMKSAGDIDHLVGEVWDVLVELKYDFVSCAFLLIDGERDWLSSYNVWPESTIATLFGTDDALHHMQRLGGDGSSRPHLVNFSGQTTLATAPSAYQEAIAAWRNGEVERHILTASEIEEMVGVNLRRYGGLLTPDSYPVRSHLHVPFEHGVFTLRTDRSDGDQFTQHQVRFLQQLVRTISIGYARYREFLRLERDRTVQRMRAEVQAMRRGEDIVDLMGLLWDELHRVGIDFDYMSISVSDGEDDDVHLYGVWDRRMRDTVASTYPLYRADISSTADLYYRQIPRPLWEETSTDYTGVRHVKKEDVAAYAERTSRLWRADHVVGPHAIAGYPSRQGTYDGAGYVNTVKGFESFVMMAARLPQGRIVVAQPQWTAQSPTANFTPEHLEILEAFADALGLGFSRFFDFQHLERHNRELEVQRSVDQLRAEVASMRQSSDIANVTVLLARQLREFDLEYVTCSFNVIDAEAGRMHLHAVGPSERIREFPWGGARASKVRDIVDSLSVVGDPVFVPDIVAGYDYAYAVEDLDGSPVLEERGLPPRIVHRNEADALETLPLYQGRWSVEWTLEMVPRSVIRVPFSHGSIAVTSFGEEKYTEQDVDLVAAYADAISLGFTRFYDFQRLEERNRELQIERAVEQVQIGVQNMKTSGDIMPVIVLLSQELLRLGLDYSWCTISIVDREAGKVRVYGTIGSDESFAETFAEWQANEE
ncbi:MAG: hypothetical protein HOH74_04745 [Gemmatimonadetes bacterium]|nr:hypothetical protein [Gemmatimonadota bacterium]